MSLTEEFFATDYMDKGNDQTEPPVADRRYSFRLSWFACFCAFRGHLRLV
jgi:hypothetical protein